MKKREIRGPVSLRFVGELPANGSTLALPEGWPAAAHTEGDPAVAAAKLASGQYQVEAVEEEVGDGNGA